MKQIRLHKFLSMCGLASRRKAEDLIQEGRVSVNNHPVTTMGYKIDPENDIVSVDGERVRIPENLVYYAYYKPRGILVTGSDTHGRNTIYDVLPDLPTHVIPVGRLDMDSEGLLLLTNDGAWANLIAHPSFEIEKEYEVVIAGNIPLSVMKKMTEGVRDKKSETLAVRKVEKISSYHHQTHLRITLTEGRNRHIRRMLETLGYKVRQLKRLRIHCIELGHLKPGRLRRLIPNEIKSVKR